MGQKKWLPVQCGCEHFTRLVSRDTNEVIFRVLRWGEQDYTRRVGCGGERSQRTKKKRETDEERWQKQRGRKEKVRALENRGKGVIERSISCGIIFLIGVVGKGSDLKRFIDSAPNGLWEICLGAKCNQIHTEIIGCI